MLTSTESRGLAFARGFIVFLIAPIHCVMMYSNPEVKSGWLGAFMAFFAQYPGAHLFMFLMGFFIAISGKKPLRVIFRRVTLLFLAGYLLNVIKFVLPHSLGLLPTDFYGGNLIPMDQIVVFRLLLINDILQFAAVGYLVCSLLRRLEGGIWLCLPPAIFVLITSPVVWDKGTTGIMAADAAIDLLGGFPPKTYFPVFPWLFHCTAGLCWGLLFKKYRFGNSFVLLGLILMLTGLVVLLREPPEWQQTFFRTGMGGTLFHAGVTIVFIRLFIVLASAKNITSWFRGLEWCSKQITQIYLIQWPIITWLLPITGYETLGKRESLIMIAFVTFLTLLAVKIFSSKTKTRHL